MNKKILLCILTVLAIILSSIICFANDGNDNLGEELKDSGNKSEHTIQNAGEGIRNIASDIGNGIQNAASDVGRGVEDVFTTDNNSYNSMDTANDGYTATRTSTDGTNAGVGGMTRTAWIWLIMGIVAIVIIALTWYYVTQNNDTRK